MILKCIIKAIIPAVLDASIVVLRKLAADTTETEIDDAFVEVLANSKEKITAIIIQEL